MASLLSLSLPKPTNNNIIKATTSTTTTVPDTLNEKFSRKGIKFTENDNKIPVVELTVRNGSSLRLQIPNAHLTSYKPKVYWKDDGCEEVLYTVGDKNGAKARGGIGLVLNDMSDNASTTKGTTSLLSNSDWTVKDVDSDAIDALQVLTIYQEYCYLEFGRKFCDRIRKISCYG